MKNFSMSLPVAEALQVSARFSRVGCNLAEEQPKRLSFICVKTSNLFKIKRRKKDSHCHTLCICRHNQPQNMPKTVPAISATQSLMSAIRLKLGWISSTAPPKAIAPINTGSNPKRQVYASGKQSTANAMRCMSLSLPSGVSRG